MVRKRSKRPTVCLGLGGVPEVLAVFQGCFGGVSGCFFGVSQGIFGGFPGYSACPRCFYVVEGFVTLPRHHARSTRPASHCQLESAMASSVICGGLWTAD